MAGNIDDVTQFLVDKATPAPAPEKPAKAAAPAPEPEPEIELDDEPVVEEEDLEEEPNEVPLEEEEPVKDDEKSDDEPDSTGDKDLFEVTVDGEKKQVSLSDLKAAYSGEGAINKRLQEATESRKVAQATRDTAVQESETARNALIAVIQQLDGMLHQPTVAMPDNSLRTSNPKAYLDQMDRYNAEVKSLTESREALSNAFKYHAGQVDALKQAARKEQIDALNANFEPIRNPETRQKAAKDILDAADHYGFTADDMQQVVDHRIYMMAYDAMQYRKLKSKGTTQLGELKEKASKPRTLRSAASRSARVSAKAKQAKSLAEAAKKSGSVDDVTALLVHNSQNRRKR